LAKEQPETADVVIEVPAAPTNGHAPSTNGTNGYDEALSDVELSPALKRIETAYDANALSKLEGLEAVRHRPAMYIGDTGVPGLHRATVTRSLSNSPKTEPSPSRITGAASRSI